MVDLRKLSYRVVAVTPDGQQLDITPATTDVGWEEGEKEYASRLSLKLHNAEYEGKRLAEVVQPLTPLFIYAIEGGASTEVARGFVYEWKPTDSNNTLSLDLTAYDECKALRENQDDFYFPEGMGSSAIIGEVLNKWGVPFRYDGPDVSHAKLTFKKKHISDIVKEILVDVRKKGKGHYFLRAKEGTVEIVRRGSNTDVYHFDCEDNLIQTSDSFSSSGVVTRVKVIGKTSEEGIPPVEAVLDGHTEWGIHQEIIERPKDKSLDEVLGTAKQTLKEKGKLKRKTTINAPDVPYIRKGDRISVDSGTLAGFWFVTSIRHNAQDEKMSMTIVEVDGSDLYDTGEGDEEGEDVS